MTNGLRALFLLLVAAVAAFGIYMFVQTRTNARYLMGSAESAVYVLDTKTEELNRCSEEGCSLLYRKQNAQQKMMQTQPQMAMPYVRPEATQYAYYGDGMQPYRGMFGQNIPKTGSLDRFEYGVPYGMSAIAQPMLCPMPYTQPKPAAAVAQEAAPEPAEAVAAGNEAAAEEAFASAPEPTEQVAAEEAPVEAA